MDPITPAFPVTFGASPSAIPAAAASRVRAVETTDDLRADDAAAQTSVGSLGAFAARFSAASAPDGHARSAVPPTVTGPSSPTTPAAPISSLPPLTPSTGSSSFTPTRTWASMVGQSGPGGASPGSAADQGMSQILDDGDVFGADGD